MEVIEHATDERVRTWKLACLAITDQLATLEEDAPAILTPYGVTVPNGNVYFIAPEPDYYTLRNPRPFVYYRRARKPGGAPTQKVRTALLAWKNGNLELAAWETALKLPFGWRSAVIVAYHVRDERQAGER